MQQGRSGSPVCDNGSRPGSSRPPPCRMRRLYAEPCLSSSVGSKISQNRSGSAWPLQIGRCSATRSGFSSNASRSITTKSTSSSVSRPHRHRYRPAPREAGVGKIVGGVTAELMVHLAKLRDKAHARAGASFPIIAMQEAGMDGFWVHRVVERAGIESHVVEAASILTSRRRRRAKTDRIDGEALLRTLLAYKRGEPRVCAMVAAPSPEEEDRRRLCRERQALIAERITHVNRIKGLLFAQGISDYAPLRRERRARLETLRTGDGRRLPSHLKAQISRELDRLELLLEQ